MKSSALLGLLLSAAPIHAVTPYQLKTPLLDTPWTTKVGTTPWPEHPRPQLVREQWRTLNGIWTYQAAGSRNDAGDPPAYPLEREVLIPSCLEGAISGIMEHASDMWFATTFTVPDGWADEVLLNFEAVDNQATVYVNQEKVGTNVGGYWRFTMNVTEVLKDGENEL